MGCRQRAADGLHKRCVRGEALGFEWQPAHARVPRRVPCVSLRPTRHAVHACMPCPQMDAAGAHMRSSLQELLKAAVARSMEAGIAALKTKFRIS